MSESYPEFAVLNKNYTKITDQEYKEMIKMRDICVFLIDREKNNLFQHKTYRICEGSLFSAFVNKFMAKNKKFDPLYMPGDWVEDSTFELFLNNSDVKKYLKVRKNDYQSNNDTLYSHFDPKDFPFNVAPLIGRLLDDGVTGVIVDGTEDFICNYLQTEKVISDMEWIGKKGWSKAERKPCKYGLCKEYKNLKQIRIPGAGHGISVYKPEFGLEIINELMFGEKE